MSIFILLIIYQLILMLKKNQWELDKYLINEGSLTRQQIEQLLKQHQEDCSKKMKGLIGYQSTRQLKIKLNTFSLYSHVLVVNCGENFELRKNVTESKEMELAVLRNLGKLWNFEMRDLTVDQYNSTRPKEKKKQNPQSYTGYVLTTGSTEGNIMALWLARDYIGGQHLLNSNLQDKSKFEDFQEKGEPLKQTIYITSQSAHFCVIKAANLVNVRSFSEVGKKLYPNAQIPGFKKANQKWPSYAPVYSYLDGRVDVQKLANIVQFFAKKKHGIILVLNYGTAFVGAFDDLGLICQTLRPIFIQTGLEEITRQYTHSEDDNLKHIDVRKGYWIHVDGALGAGYLPYLYKYYESKYPNEDPVIETINGKPYRVSDMPRLDFKRYPELSSCNVSMYKFAGIPCPCGVFMTKVKYQIAPKIYPEIIGTADTTLSSTRNGVISIAIWQYLAVNQSTIQ